MTSAPSANWYGYNDGIVKVFSDTVHNVTLNGINVLANDGTVIKQVVNPVKNDNSISFNRIEGDILYYTSNSIAYMVDLSKDEAPVAYARSLSSAAGWSVPDIVFTNNGYNYVITLSSSSSTTKNDSVAVVKFNVEDKTATSSVGITIVEPKEEETK